MIFYILIIKHNDLYNKPKAEVHPVHKLAGPKKKVKKKHNDKIAFACWLEDLLLISGGDVVECEVFFVWSMQINPLNPELNSICHLLALLGAHHFLHVSRIRVKSLSLRLLMSYMYGAPILDVSRSHTTTQHSR